MASQTPEHGLRQGAGRINTEIRLHPVELGFGQARSTRGRPMLADGPVAREILERYQTFSQPFGTKIDIEGDVGVIKIG